MDEFSGGDTSREASPCDDASTNAVMSITAAGKELAGGCNRDVQYEKSEPPNKRPKTTKMKGGPVGLARLFGRPTRSGGSGGDTCCVATENTATASSASTSVAAAIFPRPLSRPLYHQQQHHQQQSQQDDGFFTFRLERRVSGDLARHRGEERILLFRSDRPGAVAKIIYSSEAGGGSDSSRIQARIHALDVKETYRGRDLGGLLFSEAIRAIRDQYGQAALVRSTASSTTCAASDCGDDTRNSSSTTSSSPFEIRCQLDAEEDVRRHNRLIDFYQQLGCIVKPNAKTQYLYNNDGESYRKIPMEIFLRPSTTAHCTGHHQIVESSSTQQQPHSVSTSASLVGHVGGFLPVQLLETSGSKISLFDVHVPGKETVRATDWVLADDDDGNIQFRTTHGDRLVVTDDGGVQCNSESILSADDFCSFRLCCFPDEEVSAQVISDIDESDDDSYTKSRPFVSSKQLFALRNRGLYLTTDPYTHCLSCTSTPTFWQANSSNLSLTCTADTPPRRLHYRNAWINQTVQWVSAMKKTFLKFDIRRMTLKDALDMASLLPFNPLRVNSQGPSLRTFSFEAAESFRKAGHPDWVLLIALIHELGRVVRLLLEKDAAAEAEDCGYDWTISCHSRIVGCRAPSGASFPEFRSLCPDECETRYSTSIGIYEEGCGLQRVLMSWTGPEYMYFLLRHNQVSLPEEAFAMLRYFQLGDWHSFGEYADLCNDEDENVRLLVSEFDEQRREARRDCRCSEDLTDSDCDMLWTTVYSKIADKYGCGGYLRW